MSQTEIGDYVLDLLEGDLRQATEELFGGYDIAVVYSGSGSAALPTLEAPSVVSVIGYAGDQIRGALAIMATRETIHRWQPCADAGDPGFAEDTLAEFSNMLLGRLKFKLLQRGVTLLIATPTTASGSNMTLRPPAGLVSRWHQFASPAGGIAVRLDATFDPGFSFERKSPTRAPAAAGDMMLF